MSVVEEEPSASRPRVVREWFQFVLIVTPLILPSALYVSRTFVHVVFLDGIAQLPLAEAFLGGNWSADSHLGFTGAQLLSGYGILLL